MSVAKVTELSATSKQSFEDAIRVGVRRASKSLRQIRGVWVKEQHVSVDADGHIDEFRVDMMVTFVLDENEDLPVAL